MKYLFLDFDGVLNSRPFLDEAHARRRRIEREGGSIGDDNYMLDRRAVARVNRIVEATGAKVVISSSWRILAPTMDIVGYLDNVGFAGHVIGMTPSLGMYRGLEIQHWLDAQMEPPESFVILDDDSDMEHLTDRLVNTNFDTGIQDDDVEAAITLLNTAYNPRTKENHMSKSLIAVVLDASGSMDSLRTETVSALNKLIAEQQAVPGEATFTLAQFSSPEDYRIIRDAVPLADIKPIAIDDYRCSGYTALVDAMGKTIDDVGSKLAAMPDADRPDKIVFVVMTDGAENASREYKRDQVMAKVKHQTEKYNWQFLFLGAGPDAITQGGGLGIQANAAMQYNASMTGVHKAINSTSDVLRSFRGGDSQSVSYSNQHRTDNGSNS